MKKVLWWTVLIVYVILCCIPLGLMTIGKNFWEWWHFKPSQKILRFFRKRGARLLEILAEGEDLLRKKIEESKENKE